LEEGPPLLNDLLGEGEGVAVFAARENGEPVANNPTLEIDIRLIPVFASPVLGLRFRCLLPLAISAQMRRASSPPMNSSRSLFDTRAG
jgi:hypothetical protein